MRFEWDDAKNRSNRNKHGITFETATRIFLDPMLVLREYRIVGAEQRWHGIGSVMEGVILVVHAYREEYASGEAIIRIISARKASAEERRIYIRQATGR